MKKVLFFPQNKEHILNMVPVAKELALLGYEICFLDTREVYKQKYELPTDFHIIKPDYLFLDHSFYNLPFYKRILFLLRCLNGFEHLIKEYTSLVIGNDGALQRLLIYFSNRTGIKTYLVLDGLISDYTFSLGDVFKYSTNLRKDLLVFFNRKIELQLFKTFRGLIIDIFLPSKIGTSKLTKIFTIGNHSKEVLVKNKYKTTEIFAYGLPRLSQDQYHKCDESIKSGGENKEKVKVCYLTAAYKWHGKFEYDKIQHRDIEMLIQAAQMLKESKEVEIMIKVHPREDINDYKAKYSNDLVDISQVIPIKDVFINFDIIFTNISTCIIEGIQANKLVYSMMINFPFWKIRNSFVGDSEIYKIFTFNQLVNLIQDFNVNGNKSKELNGQYYISKDTSNSAILIAKEIAKA
jgi:hypothetical protein